MAEEKTKKIDGKKAVHAEEKKTLQKKEEIKKHRPVEKKEELQKDSKKEKAKVEEKQGIAKKESKKKKKIIEKWIKPKKSDEIKALRDLAKKRARRLFRGRFGQRNWIRNINKKKWQRWRIARGIDVSYKKDDGLMVKTGYRSPCKIRNVHPSGFKSVLIHNFNELQEAAKNKQNAVMLSGTLGMKKRSEILKKANELKIWVLNP